MPEVQRVQTKFTGTLPGVPYFCNMYFTPGTSPQDAADAVGDFWTGVKAFMWEGINWSTQGTIYTIDVDTLQPVGVDPVTPNTGVGVVSNDPLPRGSQLAVQWRTGEFVNGREVRGKTFLPAFCENKNDAGGDPDGATTTAIQVIAAALISDAPSEFVILSPTHHDTFVVQAATVVDYWSFVRSRRD